jgi:hypothetical protein
MPDFIQVKMFSSVFLVTLETNTVRQVIGERDGKRVARVLEPSMLTKHILEQAREFANTSMRQERGVKRVIQ